jgi:hypothetical protein
MTLTLSSKRPFAALTAIAVVAAGLALAPITSASAASPSAASQASSVVSKLNSYRSSAKLSKLKTQNDLNEFAVVLANAFAKAKTTDIEKIDFNDITINPYIPGEFLVYRVTGGSSTVISSVAAKIKADSKKTKKTYLYGDFTYTGVGLKKSGSYTYAFAFFSKIEDKLQDSKSPKISGTAAVGKTLKIDMNGWTVGGGQRTYYWTVDGNSVSDSNAPLVITPELVGKQVRLNVTVSRDGYYTVARSTPLTAKVAKGTIGTTPTPKITGSRVVGSTLTSTAGTWSTGTELTYKWKRNGVTILEATSTTYAQVAADLGKKITVSVTGTKPGYTTVTKTSSAPSATLGAFDAPVPTISVPAETVGSTFTASVGTWAPKASTYTYQWYREGVAISKATAKTYKTVDADVAKGITVKVTGKKTGYKTATVASASYLFGVSATR